MRFKPSTWYPIAVILAGLNLVAVWTYSGEPMHALAHGMAAVAFGLWAQRLKQRRGEQQAVEGQDASRMELLEDELTRLRQELTEAQERLDFTERMLAQRSQHESPRAEPRR